MYGWRTAIGIICPKDNRIIEPEFNELAPDGVSVHATRLSTVELDEMPEAGRDEAAKLNQMGADVVVYACNASSFHDGPDAHLDIKDGLERASSLPATTASTAILAALDELAIDTVDIVTPYGEDDNDRLQRFLEGNGISTGRMSGLGLASDEVDDLAKVNEETARDTYRRTLETAADAEAVLVVSTNLASVETLTAMEEELGKPVVSVNQAMFWHAMRVTGTDVTVPGYETLLSGPDR